MQFFKNIKSILIILKKTLSGFMDDKAMKFSASLAYYTVFSLGPVLVIIFSVVSLVFGKAAVEGKVYAQIKDLVGDSADLQVQEIMGNVSQSGEGHIGAIIAAVVLIISASAVFIEIKDSINYIWSVKAKPKKGWVKMLVDRLLSFSLLVTIGFLLLVALLISALIELLGDQIQEMLPGISIWILYVINLSIVLIIITGLFAIIFKVLPDAKISWRDALKGAVFTAFLFIIGKFLISLYLGNSNVTQTYGAAASVMILFLWVYYSSMILYLGAEFTKVYATNHGDGIRLKDSAVYIVKQETRERG